MPKSKEQELSKEKKRAKSKKKFKEKKFKVLVENYNTKDGKFKLGRYEILNVNRQELKDLIQNIQIKEEEPDKLERFEPQYDIDTKNYFVEKYLEFFKNEEIDDSLKIRVITKNFIIKKFDEEKFEYSHRSIKFLILKMPLYTQTKLESFENYEDSKFFRKLGKTFFLKAIIKFILPTIVPCLFLAFLFWTFYLYFNLYGFNYVFMLFWGWLIILAFCNLYYSIDFHYRKEKIDYYTPIVSNFKPVDLSGFIILIVLFLGVIYFIIFFLVAGFSPETFEIEPSTIELFLEELLSAIISATIVFPVIGLILNIIGLILIIITIVKFLRNRRWEDYAEFFKGLFYLITAPFWFVYIRYMFNREKKFYFLHYLGKYIQEKKDISWSFKNHCLNLMLEIEKTPVISVNLFSKLMALLTFILSIVPPFISQIF